MKTQLANHFKLSLDQCSKIGNEIEDMAKVPYASVIGCLMYIMVCTCPDLAHVISQENKFMSKQGRHHQEMIKWILRYLRGSMQHGIVFDNQQSEPLVVGYVDLDYAGDLDNIMSTSGNVFTLGE